MAKAESGGGGVNAEDAMVPAKAAMETCLRLLCANLGVLGVSKFSPDTTRQGKGTAKLQRCKDCNDLDRATLR